MMMPRIEAQEHLDAIRVSGLAFGTYEASDARAMQDELRRKARGHEIQQRARRASAASLAEMGIGVSGPANLPAPASQEGVSHG